MSAPASNPLGQTFRALASLKLTVVCLCFATALVFIGTLAQVNEGLYAAQARYFRSVSVWWPVPGTSVRLLFPGGYLIGGVLLLNLLAGHIARFGFSKKKLGIFLVHIGLIMLLVGQLLTDLLAEESHMRLREGQSLNYSESSARSELAITEVGDQDSERVVVVSEKRLAMKQDVRVEGLPFSIRVKEYYQNSNLNDRKGATQSLPAASTQGLGAGIVLKPEPPSVRTDRRNMPSLILELVASDGRSLGTWLASSWLNRPDVVEIGGKRFELTLRAQRFYKPMSLTLLEFRHDKYPGTEIPKNFSSRVRLTNAGKGEQREVLIYMNNPLRYAGETFYQSGFDEDDPKVTILQVVRNPGWLTPYLACILVSVGLLMQFGTHLVGFARQRRNA